MALHPLVLQNIHCAHLGPEKCIRHATDTLFYPKLILTLISIHHDVKYLCDNCSVCQEVKLEQAKETMHSRPIPGRRWQIIRSDLFTVKKDIYLIVVGM